MTQFDWAALMRVGLRQLRLRPDEFWSLTPAELHLMIGQDGGAMPMQRTQLDALMAAYPDENEEGRR